MKAKFSIDSYNALFEIKICGNEGYWINGTGEFVFFKISLCRICFKIVTYNSDWVQ